MEHKATLARRQAHGLMIRASSSAGSESGLYAYERGRTQADAMANSERRHGACPLVPLEPLTTVISSILSHIFTMRKEAQKRKGPPVIRQPISPPAGRSQWRCVRNACCMTNSGCDPSAIRHTPEYMLGAATVRLAFTLRHTHTPQCYHIKDMRAVHRWIHYK